MIPSDFSYARPTSLAEALALLGQARVMPLAGGQSLVPLLADRSVAPTLLVDISRLADLRHVAVTPEQVLIGGAATLRAAMGADVAGACPLLFEVLHSVGTTAIRNRGTLVGNLVRASPNSELPVAGVALGGVLVLRSTAGERSLEAHAFFRGPHASAVEPGELVTELRIPLNPAAPVAGGFAEVATQAGAPPLCCVAVCLRADATGLIEYARIVAGGITGVPARCDGHEAAVIGRPAADTIEQLHGAFTALQPSAALPETAYALDVLPVLIRRAATEALANLNMSAATGEHSA